MTAPDTTTRFYTGLEGDLRFGPAAPVEPATLDALLHHTLAGGGDRPAVVGDGGTLTYAELDRRSSAVARYLRTNGIGTGDRVVVVAHRCGWLPVLAVGIIRAGAVYVPVDASYPAERVSFILEDCAPSAAFALGGASLPPETEPEGATAGDVGGTVTDDSPLGRAFLSDHGPRFEPAGQSRPVRPTDDCYLIYTSGTTGTPKGALNTHLGVAAHFLWMDRVLGNAGGIRMLQKAPVSFDVGVAELLGPLSTGGTVVVPGPDWWPGDVDTMVDLISDHNVTVLSMVPSLMRVLLDVLDDFGTPLSSLSNIRHLLLGGEAVPADVVRRARAGIGCRVHGLYGPTEAAMDVTWVEYTDELISADDFDDRASLLGLPEDNVGVYVVDEDGVEVAPSAPDWNRPGELCISGPQVGNGYFGRAELTTEVFVESLRPDVDGGRMYRTGDVVSWTEVDGTRMLQFLGRIGDQVKIRGNRVELGEVESRLRELDGVRQAAAVAVSHGGADTLLAFIVADEPGAAPDVTELTSRLAESVPEYMVPTRITVLDALPVSPNGKLDRAALKAHRGEH
ncbi:amino acid adenylation domain-containing protein [Corynebacterium glyciniphilum]|uniref:amino acid adenylation domain-containing protein n=1 Tax=Corynebacterium glyciniphilum TaxID=1404244 RepID=UPI0021B22556|nr:amino acid adenylation domain-containing protein [Corynebacterium glyciniphilum]